MEIVINGKSTHLDVTNRKTFDDVMGILYENAKKNSEVIFKVSVNGEYVSEEREKQLGQLPMDDISTLEIVTKNPLDLAHESMVTGIKYVEKLNEALRTQGKAFRLKDSKIGLDDFAVCVEGLQWFFTLIESLKDPLHIASDEEILPGSTFPQLVSQSASAINELCDGREKGDLTIMADAIEYELIPCLELWRQWLVLKTDVAVALGPKR